MKTRKGLVLLLTAAMLFSVMAISSMAVSRDGDYFVTWEELPVYNGSAQNPNPVVTLGNERLSLGSDYSIVEHEDEIAAGPSVNTVRGEGSHWRMYIDGLYTILAADLSTASVTYEDTVYVGAPVRPANLKVTNAQGNEMREGVDYRVICSNNTDLGMADILIVGIGNYTGCYQGQFEIKEAPEGQEYLDELVITMYANKDLDGQVFYMKEGSDLDLDLKGGEDIQSFKMNGSTMYYYTPESVMTYYRNNQKPGVYVFSFSYYTYESDFSGGFGSDGVWRPGISTSFTGEEVITYTVYVRADTPEDTTALVANDVIEQSSDTLYLSVSPEEEHQRVGALTWTSSDPSVMSVEKGVVTLKKPGAAVITAQAGELSVSWELEIEPIDISLYSYAQILGYNPETNQVLITWDKEQLDLNQDYTVTTTRVGDALAVDVTGCNLFNGTQRYLCYPDTGYPYICEEHIYTDNRDLDCDRCLEERSIYKVEIIQTPTMNNYYRGDTMDVTGGVVRITFYDDDYFDVPMSECTLGEYDFSTVGTKYVSVYYADHRAGSVRVEVTCKEHSFGDWEVSQEASCAKEGELHRVCEFCYETETQVIEKKEHTWGDWRTSVRASCLEDGEKYRTCGYCYEKEYETIDAYGHEWRDWVVTREPTKEMEGSRYRTCFNCRERETEVIPKLSDNPFTDVPDGKYYTQPILWALDQGITTGKTATTFEPNEPCTRGQIVTFLWRAMGEPEPASYANPFTDVKESAYYYKAVLWAYYEGITTGKTDTTFEPKAPCTRCQVVTFLWRTMGEPSHSQSNPFSDIPGGKYYTNAVLWALENGITTGKTATTFLPNDTCTRAQIVTFLYRTLVEE